MSAGSEKVKKLLQTARKQIQQGEREEALVTYRRALELDPDNQQIMERINIVEREIAAMEKFNIPLDPPFHKKLMKAILNPLWAAKRIVAKLRRK